ncbi:hypothetical protein BC938DRAFT_477418 [Jimgerdemannia flammicorona]|uniref:Uncharacterized protein n=1 Tax=Jimgerdemannia flammicorona TaxID=994334 RepID=A0A433P9Z9_9FUNG|nr:hypothetical protein BC938DRAFT_477418 [Jimgerdemannia flammicorona]
MVIEVSYSSLYNLVTSCVSARTTIQICLAVKLFRRRSKGTMAILALLYLRTKPNPMVPMCKWCQLRGRLSLGIPNHGITSVERIGAPPCDTAGISVYQVNISAAQLFSGATDGIPVGTADGFD